MYKLFLLLITILRVCETSYVLLWYFLTWSRYRNHCLTLLHISPSSVIEDETLCRPIKNIYSALKDQGNIKTKCQETTQADTEGARGSVGGFCSSLWNAVRGFVGICQIPVCKIVQSSNTYGVKIPKILI